MLDFVLLGLAQITAKQDLLDPSVGQTPTQITQRTLVAPQSVLDRPQTISMVLLQTSITPLSSLRHLQIPSSLRTYTIVPPVLLVQHRRNVVLQVTVLARKELLHLLAYVRLHLSCHRQLVRRSETGQQTEGLLKGRLLGLEFLDAEVEVGGNDVLEGVFGLFGVAGGDFAGDFVEHFLGCVVVLEDLPDPVFEARLQVLVHLSINNKQWPG